MHIIRKRQRGKERTLSASWRVAAGPHKSKAAPAASWRAGPAPRRKKAVRVAAFPD